MSRRVLISHRLRKCQARLEMRRRAKQIFEEAGADDIHTGGEESVDDERSAERAAARRAGYPDRP